MTKRGTPAVLGPEAARFWRELTRKYTFRPDERRILEDACSEIDLIDDMAAAAKGAERIVKGSMGQPVINPLISELRQHRITLASLLRQLQLPEEVSGAVPGGAVRSVKARKAAQARWGKWD